MYSRHPSLSLSLFLSLAILSCAPFPIDFNSPSSFPPAFLYLHHLLISSHHSSHRTGPSLKLIIYIAFFQSCTDTANMDQPDSTRRDESNQEATIQDKTDQDSRHQEDSHKDGNHPHGNGQEENIQVSELWCACKQHLGISHKMRSTQLILIWHRAGI